MDVYRRVLVKMYEMTGGKETVDVDLSDLLKREGFFSNFDDIKARLSSESWITETKRDSVVRLTHWGAMEAKKSGNNSSGTDEIAKAANRLRAGADEFSAAAEAFAGERTEANLSSLEDKFRDLQVLMAHVRETA